MKSEAQARPVIRLSPLGIRVASGAVLLLAVIGLFYTGPLGVRLLALLIAGPALWEFRGLSDRMGFRAPSWLLYPLGIYFLFSGTVLKAVPLALILSLALIVGLSAFLFLPAQRGGLGRWAMGLAGAIYIGLPLNYYLQLYEQAANGRGLFWLLFTVLAVVASDSAALLVGMRVGRRPFFRSISPKKTVEGAIAGIAFSVPVMLVGSLGAIGIAWWHGVVLGVLIGVAAELGDLVESQMKRRAGVKDSSHLIPGHGGVLDRLDSVLFPPIIVYVYASLFHLL